MVAIRVAHHATRVSFVLPFCPHFHMKKLGKKLWSFRKPKHLNTEMLPLKKPELARRAFMASLASISAIVAGRPFDRSRFPSPQRAKEFKLFARTGGKDAPIEEKKSLAVATGELFLGLASRLIRTRRPEVEYFYSGKGRSVVVEDPPGEDVVWEQREKDVEVERERRVVTSPGFSFSAAGLLFPYHLGVAQLLLEKGYIKETTPLAGSSAGAIVCAVIASGSSMQEALQATKILADNCRLNGTAFRLGAVLRDVLNNFLPDDAHTRSNGRVRVAITQLFWRPKGLLVDQFDSKDDLINAVFTSSFIPGYLAPRPATIFRNRLCIDGGLTLFMPPTSASETVRVCAFPVNQLGLNGIGISPDCNPENRASPRQLFNWALEPAEDYILDKLFELGYMDADVWASQNPVESIIKDEDDGNGSVPHIIS